MRKNIFQVVFTASLVIYGCLNLAISSIKPKVMIETDRIQYGNGNNKFREEQLKILQQAIKIHGIKEKVIGAIDQHQFQRLFFQEGVRLFPRLPANKIKFHYQINKFNLPIACQVIYFNPKNDKIIQKGNFKII